MDIIDPYICLIFCNKRTEATKLSDQLRSDGYRVGEIHGDLEPRERKQMMRRINNNEYQYIVATDIAARGIDIDGVSHVINMEFPTERDFYIHRSGRCGRGKYKGECYSMYDSSNQQMDAKARNKRKNRNAPQSELEKEIQRIIKRPKKVKPGYKKKRKREIQAIYQKKKRDIIRKDIQKQKKERAKQAQREKRERENMQ